MAPDPPLRVFVSRTAKLDEIGSSTAPLDVAGNSPNIPLSALEFKLDLNLPDYAVIVEYRDHYELCWEREAANKETTIIPKPTGQVFLDPFKLPYPF